MHGSSKTSLTLWLRSNGFNLLSNNVTLIDKGTAKIEDFKVLYIVSTPNYV
jgi:hypothetical protein